MKDYSIGESLKRVRKEHNLKQTDIAEAFGIDRSTYSFYETGKTNPPIETMCALAKIYRTASFWSFPRCCHRATAQRMQTLLLIRFLAQKYS